MLLQAASQEMRHKRTNCANEQSEHTCMLVLAGISNSCSMIQHTDLRIGMPIYQRWVVGGCVRGGGGGGGGGEDSLGAL